jgi:hypothetical protein
MIYNTPSLEKIVKQSLFPQPSQEPQRIILMIKTKASNP